MSGFESRLHYSAESAALNMKILVKRIDHNERLYVETYRNACRACNLTPEDNRIEMMLVWFVGHGYPLSLAKLGLRTAMKRNGYNWEYNQPSGKDMMAMLHKIPKDDPIYDVRPELLNQDIAQNAYQEVVIKIALEMLKV